MIKKSKKKRKKKNFSPCDVTSWDLLSYQILYISYNAVNYSHHIVQVNIYLTLEICTF